MNLKIEMWGLTRRYATETIVEFPFPYSIIPTVVGIRNSLASSAGGGQYSSIIEQVTTTQFHVSMYRNSNEATAWFSIGD